MLGFQPDVFRTHPPGMLDLACICDNIFPVEYAGILQRVLRLDDDVPRRDETAAFGEFEPVCILGIENGVYDSFRLAVDFDLALFEPDHARGEGGDLLLGKRDAWGEVHLFGIGNSRIHQHMECGFVVRMAVETALAVYVCLR